MLLTLGRLTARLLAPGAGLGPVLDLRARAFRGGEGQDGDAQDAMCRHLVVEDGTALLATCRLHLHAPGADLDASYAARFYDLSPLEPGAKLEVGRLCLGAEDPGLLRLILAFLTEFARAEDVGLIFGTTSFPGAGADHRAALACLGALRARPGPRRRAPMTLDLPPPPGDPLRLPPLLRLYLSLGARVSDHAVVDPELDTIHVLTLLRPADIPPARLRLLSLPRG